MRCNYCKKQCIKKGKYKTIQRYQCKDCKKYQQQKYIRPIIPEYKYEWVIKLNNECCGISSIGRLLSISKSSVQRMIIRIASTIQKPVYKENNQSYEMDELRTYCSNKNNECWIIYAINKATGDVIDFIVGRRTKENVKFVVDSLLSLNPKRIYTDKLNIYPRLISSIIHKVNKNCVNILHRCVSLYAYYINSLRFFAGCFRYSTVL